MRHDQLKRALLACLLGLLLSLTSAFSWGRYEVAYYTQTGQSGCTLAILPTHCTTEAQSTPQCTSSFGGATRKWYKNSSCTEPAYELSGR